MSNWFNEEDNSLIAFRFIYVLVLIGAFIIGKVG
jgi:hypothetical protein